MSGNLRALFEWGIVGQRRMTHGVSPTRDLCDTPTLCRRDVIAIAITFHLISGLNCARGTWWRVQLGDVATAGNLLLAHVLPFE
jgi:hypothetical protein